MLQDGSKVNPMYPVLRIENKTRVKEALRWVSSSKNFCEIIKEKSKDKMPTTPIDMPTPP